MFVHCAVHELWRRAPESTRVVGQSELRNVEQQPITNSKTRKKKLGEKKRKEKKKKPQR